MKRFKKFIINNYNICSDKLPKAFDNTKIVMLSDFHNNEYGVDSKVVLRQVDMLSPDFVIVAGDMYSGEVGLTNENARVFMEELSAKHKVYYALGNHEYRMMIYPEKYVGMYDAFMDMINKTGIVLLKNETVELVKDNQIINITGLMIDRKYYKKFKKVKMEADYVESVVHRNDRRVFNILIAHNPLYFKKYAEWGADLVFSGHMHGGIARLPIIGGVISPSFGPFPKYDMGEFTQGSCKMILSAGIGTHTINLRPFNPPEIVVVNLACNKA